MRQAKLTDPAASGTAAAAPNDVDEYLARVPEPARTTLNKIRAIIRSVVPQETTEAIHYGMPAFKYKGPLLGYAAFSNHCSLFPMGASVIAAFQQELRGFESSKGTIRFPVERPPSATLIKKLVKAQIAENEQKKSVDCAGAIPSRRQLYLELERGYRQNH